MRLVDLEMGGFRHPLTDGVYGRLFPSCWCAGRLPAPVEAAMERAYREELGVAFATLAGDAGYARGVAEACGYWTIGSFAWAFPALLAADLSWGRATGRQRLLARLDALAYAAEAANHLTALGATARAMASRLRERWPAVVHTMPEFPAFAAA